MISGERGRYLKELRSVKQVLHLIFFLTLFGGKKSDVLWIHFRFKSWTLVHFRMEVREIEDVTEKRERLEEG